jgi:hypothetical protein
MTLPHGAPGTTGNMSPGEVGPERGAGIAAGPFPWAPSLRQRTPTSFRAALARTALTLPAVPTFVQAMWITRLRPELRPLAQQNLTVLFRQAEHYLTAVLARRNWVIDRPATVEARTFWSAVLGARLISESGYGGQSADVDVAGVLTVRTR